MLCFQTDDRCPRPDTTDLAGREQGTATLAIKPGCTRTLQTVGASLIILLATVALFLEDVNVDSSYIFGLSPPVWGSAPSFFSGCTYTDLHVGMSNATWEKTVSGNVNDTPKALKLHFPSCSLNYLEDLGQGRRCLHNRHVVLIGGSLTRYMYLNLVNYLETGEWIPREHPYSEAGKQWGSWTKFYEVSTHIGASFDAFLHVAVDLHSWFVQGTNARLHGNEYCDCFRQDGQPPEAILENRYYVNREQNIRVTYIQLFRHEWGMRGHNLTWLGDPLAGRLPLPGVSDGMFVRYLVFSLHIHAFHMTRPR